MHMKFRMWIFFNKTTLRKLLYLNIMTELQYPVGMATFSELIDEGYVYVDKTAYIKPLS